MEYNRERVDDCTLALLFLVMFDRGKNMGARVWKSFDWDTMDRLHEKGYIADPKSKAKSVIMTEEGCRKAEELFNKFFTQEAS